MAAKIEIEVRQQHIDQGEPGEPTTCPIAYAFGDAGYYHVYVDRSEITYSTTDNCPEDERQATTSLPIRAWLEQFDACKEVKPFDILLTQNHPLTRSDEVDIIEPLM